jgi:molybdate transport system substrate-binding protein
MNRFRILTSIVIFMALTACSAIIGIRQSSEARNADIDGTAQVDPPESSSSEQTIVVFAAASLTGAFQEIGKEFEAANPGVKVSFNFAGSQILRTQLEQGALADVFASADHTNMDTLVADRLVSKNSYQDFATNKLIVILPKANPGNVQSLGDLSKPGLKLILADSSVPAGNYARQVLEKMNQDASYGADFSEKVMANVVSNETDVKQVVAKVALGEGDVGIVYITDALASPDLKTIAIPDKFNIIASYPVAVMVNAPHPVLAQVFIKYVESARGQSILQGWGFSKASQ